MGAGQSAQQQPFVLDDAQTVKAIAQRKIEAAQREIKVAQSQIRVADATARVEATKQRLDDLPTEDLHDLIIGTWTDSDGKKNLRGVDRKRRGSPHLSRENIEKNMLTENLEYAAEIQLQLEKAREKLTQLRVDLGRAIEEDQMREEWRVNGLGALMPSREAWQALYDLTYEKVEEIRKSLLDAIEEIAKGAPRSTEGLFRKSREHLKYFHVPTGVGQGYGEQIFNEISAKLDRLNEALLKQIIRLEAKYGIVASFDRPRAE